MTTLSRTVGAPVNRVEGKAKVTGEARYAAEFPLTRLAYGWVADFVHFHITTGTWRFSWYVFNVADVAIVAGVIGLLYDSARGERAAKAP